MKNRWRFTVDQGGTFTDVIGMDASGRIETAKLLSRSGAYSDASIEGIRRLLKSAPERPLPEHRVAWIRLGTTVATNALLERKGAATGLLITQGFQDLLEIGDQRRPDLFALIIRRPELLYTAVEEVAERVDANGSVVQPLNRASLQHALEKLQKAGVTSLAIVFLHAWKNPDHENLAYEIARRYSFSHISVSHRTLSWIQVVGRGQTTLVDAYLTPVLQRYADSVRPWTGAIPIHFMSSSGSLLVPGDFTGKDAVFSGPAGGVLGVAAVARQTGDREMIGFDMGGTSTDVCRYDGAFERVLEVETAGISYYAPMLHLKTVSAGGGSILHFEGHTLSVGPDSAGAVPGPACYGLGGPPTLTDANFVLGRLSPEWFPSLFGVDQKSPLDPEASENALQKLADQLFEQLGKTMTVAEMALGFIQIANEAMARPITELSVARGMDLRRHTLCCFGGAGAQHACGIAKALNIAVIRIHPFSGLLSAYGMATAAHRLTHVETYLVTVGQVELDRAWERAHQIADCLEERLKERSGLSEQAGWRRSVEIDLRVHGTDTPLTLSLTEKSLEFQQVSHRFARLHRQYYGFDPPDAPPELLNLRIEVFEENSFDGQSPISHASHASHASYLSPIGFQNVWWKKSAAEKTPIYRREDLFPGHPPLSGPAVIVERHATVLLEPGFTARMDDNGILTLRSISETETLHRETSCTTQQDPVLLELFNNRFMGIASQMGERLAKTAHSINIKERRDFSCAVFDREGRLVANAPHVPVHLGAMGETVRDLMKHQGCQLRPGDVYASNDPERGGSHLPDITVISPVFRNQHEPPLFFVASRGHHADMGGCTPGSMPPFAKSLKEEGVLFSQALIVSQGTFHTESVRSILEQPPWPARNLRERFSDLRAQIAANNKGIEALMQLCDLYGDAVVVAYMDFMREYAARAMGEALETLLDGADSRQYAFDEKMDNGEALRVSIEIIRDASDGCLADVDFSGTAPRSLSTLNAPPAVTRAAVLYLFRTLIHQEIPLNDGCLERLRIRIPEGCLLNPGPGAAVSGGNVETSQRVVDLLCGALGVAAASQGTMNNLLFGHPDGCGMQYYETIAGGSGAVPGAEGASAVQVHMTNTRITDPEVLEHRFPEVRLESFLIRRGSGGKGRWCGGDGVIRRFHFLKPMAVSLITQRRAMRPFGLRGGQSGASGENRLRHPDGREEPLEALFQGIVETGTFLEVRTPGGGGYGCETETESVQT